ncbi:helix-turn-helix domain-containing protein [Actinomadura algeriensis]|uniref:Transcriptional regulator with XRE-family HTH domain n=1 Tax=Actinomadura algeriensis TaxID=1679523 RepID=A0ABR9JLL6_9ACTN|nr:helix-turn-helix transcriptional regulator [Actinomadura algeriensis]MBE1531458.1 transcriptional regulator with XRE-family HTH domain [Actinomadura algeriensis]
MSNPMATYGAELRRKRLEAGLSLAQLGALLHYSKGHLSKIEHGRKFPSPELARMSDAVLGADGTLIALASRPRDARLDDETPDDGVWQMNLSLDGESRFHPVNRREALTAASTSMLGFGLGARGMAETAGEPTALDAFRALFAQLRNLGQTASPGAVLPLVITQTHVLRDLASRAPARTRDELLVLGARFAEYGGWMSQESGDDRAALWWTAKAVEMAAAGGDHDLAVYALVRRALVTLYREDAAQTVELAHRAWSDRGVPPRIRGLAAQREAQGHALAGDRDACMRGLDRARRLLAADPGAAASGLGSRNLPDPVSMVTGWCLFELGRTRDAAEILDAEVARIPPEALRSRARYGARQALAHAAAGEIDHACELTGRLLPLADVVGSATITTDLRRLARVLGRRRDHAPVRELYPALTASLRPAAI